MSHILKKYAIFGSFILYILYFDFTTMGFIEGLLVAKEYYPVDSIIELFFYIPTAQETAALTPENLFKHALNFSVDVSCFVHLALALLLKFVSFPFLNREQQDFLEESFLPRTSARFVQFFAGQSGTVALAIQFGLSFFGLSSIPSYLAYFAPEMYIKIFVNVILKGILTLIMLAFPFVIYSFCKNMAVFLTSWEEVDEEHYVRPSKCGLLMVEWCRCGYLINPPTGSRNPLRSFFVEYIGLIPVMFAAAQISYYGILIDSTYNPVHVNVRYYSDFCAGYMVSFLMMQNLPVPNSAFYNFLASIFSPLETLYEDIFQERNEYEEISMTMSAFIPYFFVCYFIGFNPIFYVLLSINHYSGYSRVFEGLTLFEFYETFYAGLYVTYHQGGFGALFAQIF